MKYVVIIGDGMADFPSEELGGKTPLMVARKPNMDRMAREGFCGQVATVPPGFSPGSDVACMSLFGYDPARYYTGRAPIEAYGMGINMDPDDVAFRCNLVHLDVRSLKVFMGDYSGGHITTEEARILIKELAAVIGDDQFRFFPGISYRHLMIWKNGKSVMKTVPPHDILDKEIARNMPEGEGADRIIKIMSDSQIFLNNHRVNLERINKGLLPANSIWLWGQGTKPSFPSFEQKYRVAGAVVAAVDLVKGIGALAGFDTPKVQGATGYLDTDYSEKARKALELLETRDIVYVHVEAPDEASHAGNSNEKIRAIEQIDGKIVGHLLDRLEDRPVRFLLTTDHATPVSLRTHHATPVPFAVFEKGVAPGHGAAYDEQTGGNLFSGEQMVTFFLKGSRL
jgi:2,3-bisphosphoglycerate-independent phosphoglycerate mutase